MRHLRYFVAVAETCHFGRAAERLHIAQPALSQAIRQLEGELDADLFTRSTRQVALTAAGEFLLGEARRVLDTVEDSVRGVRRISAGSSGLVRIGFTGTAAFSQLPRIARTVQSDLPGLALEVSADMLTPAQCEGLRTGSLDIGVLRPPVHGDGIDTRTLADEQLILAVPTDHRLAVEPAVSIVDLRTEDFIGYAGRDSAVNHAVQSNCQAAGFSPHIAHGAAGTAVLLALVAGGLGIAVLPDSVRSLPLEGVVFRELADATSIELVLAWRRGTDSPQVHSVLDALAGNAASRPVFSEVSR